MHSLDVKIGKKVRYRRWFLGMSQRELASAVGVQFQQIQKYEIAANRISASRLWLIAKALSVPITFFYEEADSESGECCSVEAHENGADQTTA